MINALKRVPGVNLVLGTEIWKTFRYQYMLNFGNRQNSTCTGFLRLPSQYEALAGPVLDFLLADSPKRPLKITVLGCSNGSEPYTIASVLTHRRPELEFEIHAYDLYREIIYKGKSAVYERDEVYNNPKISEDFVKTTFDIEDHLYKVKEEISRKVNFGVANALDKNLSENLGTSDIVFSQNFIVHLKPKMAKEAFNNIYHLLNPRAVLFIDGMDLDVRQKLTNARNMVPLDYKISEIHHEAYKERVYAWPLSYWAVEPFSGSRRDWKQRYSTIFLKSDSK